MSYFDGNEARRTDELVRALGEGARVVVVSDAGMPSVSDPGYRIVTAAVEHGFRVTAVPGPSAVLTALAVSGLPVDRFCFEGFLPRKASERGRRLSQLGTEPRTMIFFEAPHRAGATLSAMAVTFGVDRRGAVCRELTKTHEEIRRGSLQELADWAASDVRGEVTLVIGGATQPTADLEAAAEEALGLAAGGMKLRAAAAQVAREQGLAKNALYELAVKMRRPRDRSKTSRRQNAPLMIQYPGDATVGAWSCLRCLTRCPHQWWTRIATLTPRRPSQGSSPRMRYGWPPTSASHESSKSDVIRKAAAGQSRLPSAGQH